MCFGIMRNMSHTFFLDYPEKGCQLADSAKSFAYIWFGFRSKETVFEFALKQALSSYICVLRV